MPEFLNFWFLRMSTFLQICCLILPMISAYFLVKGTLELTAEDIASLVTSRWGHNADLVKNLSRQKIDTITGFLILIINIIFQIGYALHSTHYDSLTFKITEVPWACLFLVFIFVVSNIFSKIRYKKLYKKIENKLKK